MKRLIVLLATCTAGCIVSTETVPGETGPAGADGVAPFVEQANGAITYTAGPVGIGTTAPLHLFDVVDNMEGHSRIAFSNLPNSSSSAEILEISAGDENCAVQLAKFAPDNAEADLSGMSLANFGALTTNCAESAGLIVGTGTAPTDNPLILITDAQQRMRITGDGRVGIGTSVPDAGFHVANGGTLLTGENAAHDASTLIVRNENPTHGNASPILEIEQESTPGPFLFMLARTTDGGLGTNATDRFYVDGGGNAFFDGCITADNVNPCASDVRLKKNVLPLTAALTRLLRLRGVTYEWREPAKFGNRTGQQIGMIAQQVEEVFPQWVGANQNGYKTLNISGFEALAIESLREIKTENDNLRTANKDLSSKVVSLEARLSKLEQLIQQVTSVRRKQ